MSKPWNKPEIFSLSIEKTLGGILTTATECDDFIQTDGPGGPPIPGTEFSGSQPAVCAS